MQWTPLTDNFIRILLTERLHEDFPDYQLKEVSYNTLSFYPDSRLLLVLLTDEFGDSLTAKYLLCSSSLMHLNPSEASLYIWNEKFGIVLTPDTVIDYLHLFFSDDNGQYGNFHIIDSEEDLLLFKMDDESVRKHLKHDPDFNGEEIEADLLKDTIRSMIVPSRLRKQDESGNFVAELTLLYKTALFRATASVSTDGTVNLDQGDLLYDNLPVNNIFMEEKTTDIIESSDLRKNLALCNKTNRLANKRVIEEVAKILLRQALVRNRTHLLFSFSSVAGKTTKDDIDIFARLVNDSRPVVVIESHFPYIEEVICDIILQLPGNKLTKVKPELRNYQGATIEYPAVSNDNLLLLPMHSFTGIANEQYVSHEITVSEAAVFIGCASVHNLPSVLRDMADMVIRLPEIGADNFPEIIKAVFGFKIPDGHSEKNLSWTNRLLLNDIVQANRIVLTTDDILDYLEKRVNERSRLFSADNSPRLKDLYGLGEAKEVVSDLIADINDALLGKIEWDEVDKGMLIVGPPGTGKTTLAKAIARECGIKFISVSASKWQSADHLGQHIAAITNDFALARRYAPSIMFIDEIDSLGKRSADQDNAYYQNMVVNTVLQEIQGFIEKEKVIVIGATNFDSLIDPALMRAGRLDKVVHVKFPNTEALEKIYEYYLSPYKEQGRLDKDIDFKTLGNLSFGLSGADVEQFVRGAFRRARHDNTSITQDHLLAVITGRSRDNGDSTRISPDKMKRIAVHEAGHALTGILNESPHGKIAYISIIPRNDGRMGFVANAPSDTSLYTYSDYLNIIEIILGGRAAEEIYYGKEEISSGAGGGDDSDLAKASKLAASMVSKLGFGNNTGLLYSDSLMAEQENEVRSLLNKVYDTALKKLSTNKPLLALLVSILIEKQEISGDELRDIIFSGRHHPLYNAL